MSIYAKVQKNIAAYYQSLQQQYSAKYVKEFMIGSALLVVVGGGYFLNSWYVQNREQKAFQALSEVVVAFKQAEQSVMGLNPTTDAEKINQVWNEAIVLIDALYNDHMSSHLAPCILAYKAQVVLAKDHDVTAAVAILDEALPRMPKMLQSIFELQRVKMLLDNSDENIRAKALQSLQSLAQDATSVCQQEAQYVLGLYYVSQGQVALAQQAWQHMLVSVDNNALIQSPWVILAQEKLGSAV